MTTHPYSCLENSTDKGTWWATTLLITFRNCSSAMYVLIRTCNNNVNQFSSVAQACLTLCDPWTAAHQASLSVTNSWGLLKLMSIKSAMPSNHLILCHPFLLPTSIFPSTQVFSNELVHHIKWPNDWSFSFSISPSDEYSELISFRMDWLDLLAVQRTPQTLLQHHSSKASILQCSPFFIVQLPHPYMTTGKNHSLD